MSQPNPPAAPRKQRSQAPPSAGAPLKRRRLFTVAENAPPSKDEDEGWSLEYEHAPCMIGKTYNKADFGWEYGSIPKRDEDFVHYTTAQLVSWLERFDRVSANVTLLCQGSVDEPTSQAVPEMSHIAHRCYMGAMACRRVLGSRRDPLAPIAVDPTDLPHAQAATTLHGKALMFAVTTGVSALEALDSVQTFAHDDEVMSALDTQAEAAAAAAPEDDSE